MKFTAMTSAMLLAFMGAASVQAATPAVQGPESVQDWYQAGQAFIRSSEQLVPNTRRARNVIFFVGDGMGVTTQTAARILEGQLKGHPGEENRLSFETLPYTALSKTYSWDQQTSDSAPTMTAMVTGYKAREGMLSVNHLTPRGECDAQVVAATTVPTILELAARHGKATGVVSTARLTHATPGATYAHTPVRDWEADANQPAGCGVKDIARQLIEVSPEVRKSLKVAMGGGRINFMPRQLNGVDVLDPEYPKIKGRRNDGRDLTAEWLRTRGAGARYVWSKAGFDAVNPANTEYLLGLFEPSHMQYETDRASDVAGEPSLTEMTAKAISLLQKSPQGYFLHVEGGRIDHAHHAGYARRALTETIELSNAVRKAMELTRGTDTLIIVTADHSHTFTMSGYPHRGNDILGLVKDVPTVDGHPSSVDKARDGKPYTTLGYLNGPGAVMTETGKGVRADLSQVDTTDLEFLQQAAIPTGAETHGGEDVAIWASGPWAHLVHGSMEQNWIFHVMKAAFGFTDGATKKKGP